MQCVSTWAWLNQGWTRFSTKLRMPDDRSKVAGEKRGHPQDALRCKKSKSLLESPTQLTNIQVCVMRRAVASCTFCSRRMSRCAQAVLAEISKPVVSHGDWKSSPQLRTTALLVKSSSVTTRRRQECETSLEKLSTKAKDGAAKCEASWRRISVGKGPPQQSYPKDAVYQSFNRRLRPLDALSRARPREVSDDAVTTWSYTESRWSTVSTCDTTGTGSGTGEEWAYRVVLFEWAKWAMGDGGGKRTRGVSGGRAADKPFKVKAMFVRRK
ncbi:hypothetical protein DFH06DRAFT_1409792 [Mycena polygramma]|nr:hypothetical protein DFH06DRAFT_1409792 [Mycena polygramma]